MPHELAEAIRSGWMLDACCYHAAVGTVLRWHGCAEPELVIGAGCSTYARRTSDRLAFDDIYPGLSTMLRRRGHGCLRRPATERGSWFATLDRLDRGLPVIGLVDPFFLPYHWIDSGRTHSHHAVVLWSFDRDNGTVLLCDPSEILAFVGTLPLAGVQASWSAEERGQSWLDVEPSDQPLPDLEQLLQELRDHAGTLTEDGAALSGASLARSVADHLDEHLDLAQRVAEPAARLGTDERRRRNSHFLRGLWNYHHTLRWFALHVHALARRAESPRLAERAAEIDQLSQSWLVLRNLIVKCGLSGTGRRATLASFCAGRLARLAEGSESAAAALLSTVDALLAEHALPEAMLA